LKDHNIEQLYPEPPADTSATGAPSSQWTLDRAFHLKKMTRSIMLNFLELVGMLSRDVMPINDGPPLYEEKMRQLSVLFFNAHQLINEYRPHQARESLIIMMEEQLERKRNEIESAKRMKEKVASLLGTLGEEDGEGAVPVVAASPKKVSKAEQWKDEQRAIWAALQEDMTA
jgi:mediator of RNA polymerase II transcription subunit 7